MPYGIINQLSVNGASGNGVVDVMPRHCYRIITDFFYNEITNKGKNNCDCYTVNCFFIHDRNVSALLNVMQNKYMGEGNTANNFLK